MAVVSYGVSTELDAVNSILMSVGESPVNTITNVQSPEVVIAKSTLRQVCREVQTEGWKFNTENEYKIALDTNGHCIIPNNVLQIDLNHFKHLDHHDVVRRNDNGTMKLYDLTDHTFDFDGTDPLYCDIIWMIQFDDIPQVFKDYVTIRASRIAANRMVNDTQNAELMATDESLARALVMEYDTNQGDYNVFNDQQYRTNPASTYRPYQVLKRR